MENLSGMVFGKLTVVRFSHSSKSMQPCWECLCECGNTSLVFAGNLKKGNTTSCGCVKLSRITKHGKAGSVEYVCWVAMVQRCTNPSNRYYANYGGRGITVCDDWLKFENFYRDMGDRPSDLHSIDRIDNNKGYCKENCRWATRKAQNSNKRDNVLVTLNGETRTITEWASLLSISPSAIKGRLYRGWPVSEALTKPSQRSKFE